MNAHRLLYSSYIRSLLLHGLVFLALFYLLYYKTERNPVDFAFKPKKDPAQVTFQPFNQGASPRNVTHPLAPQPQKSSTSALQPASHANNLQKKQHQSPLPVKNIQKNSSISLPDERKIAVQPEITVAHEEKVAPAETVLPVETNSATESDSNVAENKGIGRSSMQQINVEENQLDESGARHVSGSAFMNAFRRAHYEEREEGNGQNGNGTVYAHNSSQPAHVKERLEEWQFAHFRQRISRALIKATRIHRKYFKAPIDINKELFFSLLINEQGRLINLHEQTKTGIEELDAYIEEFFKITDFPPIPKRFNMKEFAVKVWIRLKIPEGQGIMLQLEPMVEA